MKETLVFVEWSKKLEIGVDFVDADHKILINLLNQINDCVDQHEESSVVGSVLESLVAYTDYHFLREERMLELSGYADLEEHKNTHSDLSQQVRRVYLDYQADPWNVDPVGVRDFLRSWLIDHIMGHDFAYRDCCDISEKASAFANDMAFLPNTKQDTFSDWANIRIMVVDDNPNFRKLIQTILKAVGVRHLQLVSHASEGIIKLSQRPVDVVLCDMVMDEMSGASFARQLQKMDLPTKIIMFTGFSTDEMKDRCSGLDVTGFIEKPLQARLLLETIAAAAPNNQMISAVAS